MDNNTNLPKIPPEVMSIILSNLGRNDLLNCRLVSRFWNKICLTQLKKSKYTIRLDLKKIKSYIEFTKSNLKYILPFYIDLNMVEYNEENSPKQILPLHVLNLFKKNLNLLIYRFGPECVVGLNLCVDIPDRDRYSEKRLIFLTDLFFIVSASLKMLHLNDLYMNSEAMGQFMFKIKQWNINFPNLKKLEMNNLDRGLTTIVKFILENSPRMKNLKMKSNTHASVISAISIPFGKLETLNLGFKMNPSELLMKIQDCKFLPTLQKLKLCVSFYDKTKNEIEMYHNILNFFSKNLKILSIQFCGDGNVLRINFPKFPELQHLIIKIKNMERYDLPVFLNPYDANFNPDTFPVLKHITIPRQCFFMTKASYKQLGFNNSSSTSLVIPKFTNITILTIIIQGCDIGYDESMSQFYQKYVKHLQPIFTNVASVVMMNNCCEPKDDVKKLIKELIQSDLSSNIQDITFWNFDQDYLGQVLKQLSYPPRLIIENVDKNYKFEKIIKHAFQSWTDLPDVLSITSNVLEDEKTFENHIITLEEKNKRVNHKMTNIKTIKYEQYGPISKKPGRKYIKNMMLNELKLTMMVKHFPNLRQIGISSFIFDQDDKQKCSEQIQNLRIQFPNITFNII